MKSDKQLINKHIYLQFYKNLFLVIENEFLGNSSSLGLKKIRCFKNFLKLNFNLSKKINALYPLKMNLFFTSGDLFIFLASKKIKQICYVRLFFFEFFACFFLSYFFAKFILLKNLKLLLLRSVYFPNFLDLLKMKENAKN